MDNKYPHLLLGEMEGLGENRLDCWRNTDEESLPSGCNGALKTGAALSAPRFSAGDTDDDSFDIAAGDRLIRAGDCKFSASFPDGAKLPFLGGESDRRLISSSDRSGETTSIGSAGSGVGLPNMAESASICDASSPRRRKASARSSDSWLSNGTYSDGSGLWSESRLSYEAFPSTPVSPGRSAAGNSARLARSITSAAKLTLRGVVDVRPRPETLRTGDAGSEVRFNVEDCRF